MIGLDTNIVLRLFDRTDALQTSAAEELLRSPGSPRRFMLSPIVLSEFAWTLRRQYRQPRGVIADHLDQLLQANEFVVPFAEVAIDAVRQYRAGPADFADYLLAGINCAMGCDTTLTFDKDAATDRDLFSLLEV